MSKITYCKMRFKNVKLSEREMHEIIGSKETIHNNKTINRSIWASSYIVNDQNFKSSSLPVKLYELGGCIYGLEGSITFINPTTYQSDVYWKIEAESFELEVDDELVKYLIEGKEREESSNSMN
ncbi:MAG: hypothetical protein HC924_03060 [Synechococcaceae cyanobacterium SM2_3_2]|nr:hypothetical protein [Synechococcaceae cyanobacterium SM2_3_2]